MPTSNFGVSTTISNLVGGAIFFGTAILNLVGGTIFLKEKRQIDNISSFCTHFLEYLTGSDIFKDEMFQGS